MPCDFLVVQAYDNLVLARIEKDRLLDVAGIAALSEDLIKLTDRYPRISLVLDLEAVSAMSSAMLGKLVSLHKAVTGLAALRDHQARQGLHLLPVGAGGDPLLPPEAVMTAATSRCG
jgi:hypothetical protein